MKKFIFIIIEFRMQIAFYIKQKKLKRKADKFVNSDFVINYKKQWKKISSWIFVDWMNIYYNLSGIESPDYVPENVYYSKIEPTLNNRIYSFSYADKNFYNILYNSEFETLTKVYLRKINGVFYSSDYKSLSTISDLYLSQILESHNEYILKPSAETSGGENVVKINRKNDALFLKGGKLFNIEYLNANFKENFIIQESIDQHEFFKQFNSSSVNTLRVYIYRSVITEDIIPLSVVLRIGKQGSIVDNQASGGISCGIDMNGILNDFAIDKKGNKFYEYNNVDFSSIKEVYKFNEIIEKSIVFGRKLLYSRLNGLDFCVDSKGNVRLLEINTKNIEINFLQMNNGPLFKEYTDEIIEFCVKNPKIVTLHSKIFLR